MIGEAELIIIFGVFVFVILLIVLAYTLIKHLINRSKT